MGTDNQPVNTTRDPGIEKLQDEYERSIKQPLPRRSKGIPYPAILIFSLSPAMLLAGLILTYLVIRFHNDLLTILALVFLAWLTFIFPERFFSLQQRTTRNSFRRYPKVKSVAKALDEPGGRFLEGAPILRIDGRPLFLLRYGKRQSPIKNTPGEINGMAVCNKEGQLIDNEEILKKAFRTIVLADICGHEVQTRYTRIRSYSLQALQRTLPRAESILKKAAKAFEENNLGSRYLQIMDQLPSLYESMKSGISIHDGDDNFRRALGWSFGLEFFYEDALAYENMCRSYVTFMEAAYGTQLANIIQSATELSKTVQAEGRWRNRRNIAWALMQLNTMSSAIKSWIFTYSILGKISGKDWDSYRRKLNRARSLGLQIVQQ